MGKNVSEELMGGDRLPACFLFTDLNTRRQFFWVVNGSCVDSLINRLSLYPQKTQNLGKQVLHDSLMLLLLTQE